MAAYRISRSIEASLIDWLTEELEQAEFDVRVEKVFANVYKGTLPCVLIQQNLEEFDKLEIGSKTNIKYFYINIRIFAKDDGLRLDLKDFITELLEDDINYYSYIIVNGVVTSKMLSGKIVVLNILRNEKELINTENLESEDKYRHLISFRCYVAQ